MTTNPIFAGHPAPVPRRGEGCDLWTGPSGGLCRGGARRRQSRRHRRHSRCWRAPGVVVNHLGLTPTLLARITKLILVGVDCRLAGSTLYTCARCCLYNKVLFCVVFSQWGQSGNPQSVARTKNLVHGVGHKPARQWDTIHNTTRTTKKKEFAPSQRPEDKAAVPVDASISRNPVVKLGRVPTVEPTFRTFGLGGLLRSRRPRR